MGFIIVKEKPKGIFFYWRKKRLIQFFFKILVLILIGKDGLYYGTYRLLLFALVSTWANYATMVAPSWCEIHFNEKYTSLRVSEKSTKQNF